MLRLIIIALIVYGVFYVGSSMMGKYKQIDKDGSTETSPAKVAPAQPADLDGMPPQLQASLDAAEAQGPAALKRWLETHRKYCRDPKLGDIEIDLAVALMRQNTVEAKKVFANVKARTPPSSPLQPRIKSLSKTFN
jgi:hypothetical protein